MLTRLSEVLVTHSPVAREAMLTVSGAPATELYAAKNAPRMEFDPSPQLQSWASKGAFLLMIIWVIWIASQYVLPSKRGRAQVGWGKFMASGAVCIVLLDLSIITTIVNNILDLFWWAGTALGLTG